MTGREVAVLWGGRKVRAWLPDLLADLALTDNDRRATAAERARQSLINADLQTPTAWEPLARLLLRAEGIASSYIEGVAASVPDVAAAQSAPGSGTPAAAWVAANLTVLDTALDHAHGDQGLELATLNDWHRALMAGHTLLDARMVGALREEQGWIGGSSPLDAALVTAPVRALGDLMADLLAYVNRTDIHPVTQAAVAHAQFEIIHPYGDGNGRLGRVLMFWVLARRTGVRVLPPVSTRIAADPGAYLAGLTLFRLGSADSWIRWFADTVTDSAARIASTMLAVRRLQDAWSQRLDEAGVRRDAAARRILVELPRQPVLTSHDVGAMAHVSERAARAALETLSKAGIVQRFPGTGGRPPIANRYAWWFAPEVTGLINAP